MPFVFVHFAGEALSAVGPGLNGGFDPNYGARPMRKTIESPIESRIAEWILRADTLPQGLAVNVVDGCVCVQEI